MRKLLLVLMSAATLLGTMASSYAQEDWRGGIRARIHDSRVRIDRGIQQGSLTRHEAGRLNRELNGILAKIDRMKADGHLSDRERSIINRDLDRLSRDISREKHNERRY